jgi:hypothetical protein
MPSSRSECPICGHRGPFALDGFCGVGGWTKGLIKAGFHVVGFDIEPQPDYPGHHFEQRDARHYRPMRDYDVVVMSPPCTGFSSFNFLNPEFKGVRPRAMDFELVAHAMRIIGEANPRYWAVENVAGAVSWFEPMLGPPAARIAPFYLWGHFPGFLLPTSARVKFKTDIGHDSRGPGKKDLPPIRRRGISSKKAAALAAEIPDALSGPFADACAAALAAVVA